MTLFSVPCRAPLLASLELILSIHHEPAERMDKCFFFFFFFNECFSPLLCESQKKTSQIYSALLLALQYLPIQRISQPCQQIADNRNQTKKILSRLTPFGLLQQCLDITHTETEMNKIYLIVPSRGRNNCVIDAFEHIMKTVFIPDSKARLQQEKTAIKIV